MRLTVMLLLNAPAAVGWKATLKLQLPPAAAVTLLHVLADGGKCVASGVLAVTASADADPAFVMVIVVVALVALTAVDGKAPAPGPPADWVHRRTDTTGRKEKPRRDVVNILIRRAADCCEGQRRHFTLAAVPVNA
jgi:predicted small lipoprotein YifL